MKYRETKVVNYRQEFISKPVARPEYGKIYQHKGMLL